MTTQQEPTAPAPEVTPAAPAAEAAPPPSAAPAAPAAAAAPTAPAAPETPAAPPRITPSPSGERGPQMIERTRRRGRRRRAPVFTPPEVRNIDYKDVDKLKKLISDRGRIEPRRKTGLTAKDQRKLSREIKRARFIALLPYTAEHMRQTSRYRMVSRMVQRAERAAQEVAEQQSAPPAAESAPAPEAAPAAAPAPEPAPQPAAESAPGADA